MKYLDLAIANEQIKTLEIKGNDYALVNQRIKAFRMVYPQGFIIPHLTSNKDGVCVFTAEVGYYVEHNTITEDKNDKKYQDTYLEKVVLGVGTAYEKEDSSYINKTSYIENCETSAVGRALGMAGFGIDVSVASAEEMQNAIENQKVTKEEADDYKLTFGKYNGKTLKEVYKEDEGYIQWMINNTKDDRMLQLISLATGIEVPSEEESKQRLELINTINNLATDTETDFEEIHKHFGVDSINKLTLAQLKECELILKKKEKSND